MSTGELRGLVLQLQEEAPSGLLGDWARRRDIALDVAPIEAGAPDPSQHAFAVVLGSERSLAEDSPDWARDVLDWVRAADAAQVPVLGICFGAQALAAAFGGSVHRLAAPEVGWVEVATNDADRVPAGPWLAWHEDGLRPPPLAYELASNRFGSQAFCLRRHLAVQFHPEATADIVADWTAMPDARLDEVGHTAESLIAECRQHADGAAARAERLFDGFAARAGIAPPVTT